MGIWKQRIDESWLKCTGNFSFKIINAKGGTLDPSEKAIAISLKHSKIDSNLPITAIPKWIDSTYTYVRNQLTGFMIDGIGENSILGTGVYSYILDYYFGPAITDTKKFRFRKNYQFKTHAYNFAYAAHDVSYLNTTDNQPNQRLYNSSLNIFKGALGINPTWEDSYYFDVPYYKAFDKTDATQPTMYILYYYSSPSTDVDSDFVSFTNKLTSSKEKDETTYRMNKTTASQSVYAAGYGIAGLEINEIGWSIQGYSFASYDNDPGIGDYKNQGVTNSYSGAVSTTFKIPNKKSIKQCVFGKGWYYDDATNEYTWYDRQFSDTQADLNTNNNPVGGDASFQESNEGYRTNNYIAKYIPFRKFNISFLYECLRSDSGIKVYLSPTLPSSSPSNSSKHIGQIAFPDKYFDTSTQGINDYNTFYNTNSGQGLSLVNSQYQLLDGGITIGSTTTGQSTGQKYPLTSYANSPNIYAQTIKSGFSLSKQDGSTGNAPILSTQMPATPIDKGTIVYFNIMSEYADNGNEVQFKRSYTIVGTYGTYVDFQAAWDDEIDLNLPRASTTHPDINYTITCTSNILQVTGIFNGNYPEWYERNRFGRVYSTISIKQPTIASRSTIIMDYSEDDPNKALVNNINVDDTSSNLSEIRVNMTLRHTYVGDLIINLRVPNGNVINLKAKGSGEYFNDLRNITFTTNTDSPKMAGLNFWPNETSNGYVWDPIGLPGASPAYPVKAPWLQVPYLGTYNFDWAQLRIRSGLTFQMDKTNGQGTIANLNGFNNILKPDGDEEIDFASNINDLKFILNEDGTFAGTYSLYIKDDSGGNSGIFEDWNIEFLYQKFDSPILSLTQSDPGNEVNPGNPKYQYLFGIEGNQYLVIVGDKVSNIADPHAFVSTTTGTAPLLDLKASLSNLKIDGGYHVGNNKMYQVNDLAFVNSGVPSFGGENTFALTNPIDNLSYTAYTGYGNLNEGSLSIGAVNAKIGNGKFLSGIWENGAWNSGWRKDESMQEFYAISDFFSYNRDKRWRFSIEGSAIAVSKFEVGDKVSIGNIAAIDINEERKLIKSYFTIMGKSNNSIEVEFESDFPIRRIKIDSDIHRIYMTKNVWLTGGFFNGYFTGIWNHGLFKGFPYITEMFDSHWVDGKFEGGHFQSRKKSLSFSNTYQARLDRLKVGITFDVPHKLATGDSIVISSTFTNFGSTTVLSVTDDYNIITDINWDISKDPNTYGTQISGTITTNLSTGLVQNIDFTANNISTTTSLQSMDSTRVFIYDSWMDVNFDSASAVNIGKPQSTIDNSVSAYAYSDNNLYGYPTYDVLSSNVTFRDSFSNTIRNYRLGSKYKIYENYIGDAGNFDEYFDITGWATKTGTYKTNTAPFSQARTIGDALPTSSEFTSQGWVMNKDSATFSAVSFERTTEALDETDPAAGKEMKVSAVGKGGVLNIQPSFDITNRTNSPIERQRYTVISFDMIQSILPDFVFEDGNKDLYDYSTKYQPLIHFNNLNYALRNSYIPGTGYRQKKLDSTYLPVYKNVNHAETSNKTKIEYFYNKTNLSMFFRGNGLNGRNLSTFVLDNLKLYEVDMIPFFQYFTEENINRSISVPYQAIAPEVDYSENDYSLLDNSIYGLDSFFIYQPTTETIVEPEYVADVVVDAVAAEVAMAIPTDNFNYPNFSSSTGLSLIPISILVSDGANDGVAIYITNTDNNKVGNVYRQNAIRYDRSFSVEWKFNCSKPKQEENKKRGNADGFCLQWNLTKNENGGTGEQVGRLESAINAISFLTHTNNKVQWWEYKTRISNITQTLGNIGFRQNVYYWFDYDHAASTGKVYYSTTNKKPTLPQHSYKDFKFDSKDYHIGFGAATGSVNAYHILKSFKLTFL